MRRVCVFCGASAGNDPRYAAAAADLGRALAARTIEAVTGGGKVGLMGVVADATLGAGGRVIGVIPRFLEEREVAHRGLSELHVVESLHERKALMHELSDGFIVLPGGFGTLDELMESVTWAQLDLHAKPIGILNVAGYFDELLAFVEGARRAGFIPAPHGEILTVCYDATALVDALTHERLPGGV
jgi:uncharacterized protein (TIGR00730 family)